MSTDEKVRLIETLLNDFKSSFPNHSHAEAKHLKYRLHLMSIEDLRILIKGLKNETRETQSNVRQ